MKDSSITELILVQYPSNHCFVVGPKIFLLGKGSWKHDVLKKAEELWTDVSLNFYFLENEDYTNTDQLSWAHQTMMNCDFIIAKIQETMEMALVSKYVAEEDYTFFIDTNDIISKYIYEMNKNVFSSELDLINELRKR